MSLVLLMIVSAASLSGAADDIHVKVYYLLYGAAVPAHYNDAIGIGFNASMASKQWLRESNVSVEVVHPSSYDAEPVDGLQTAIEQNRDELFVSVGPLNDADALSFMPLLKQENLVTLGPYTGSNSVRGWNPNLYFLFVSPVAELLTLLRFAVTQLRLRRIGFMYLQNVSFGDNEYLLAVELMSHMGRELCGVFTVKSSVTGEADSSEFDTAWNRFAETHPQGVIIFSPLSEDTAKFIKNMIVDNRTRDAHFLSTLPHEAEIESAWRWAADALNVTLKTDQVILTGVVPRPTSTEYAAVRRCRSDVESYLNDHTNSGQYSSLNITDLYGVDGEPVMYGWIVGEVLSQSLANREFLSSRKEYMESLYRQRRYVINDLVIGDFGGECGSAAADYGAACNCNQGGNVVYLNSLSSDYALVDIRNGLTVFNPSSCYYDGMRVESPVNGLIFLLWDNPAALRANGEIYGGVSVLTGDGTFGQSDRLFLQGRASASSAASSALMHELDTKVVTALFGAVSEEMLATADVVFIDPITLNPELRHNGSNVIYLSPTLEQQLFVISGYLVRKASGRASVLFRGRNAQGVEDAIRRTFLATGTSLDSFATLDKVAALKEKLPKDGYAIVIGINVADVGELKDHLDANPDVYVFVPFFDMALMYSGIARTFNGSPSAYRLLFPTSLPHWADVNTTSETVRRFHAALRAPSVWTPLRLLGFATARFTRTVLQFTEKVTPKTLTETIFAQSVIAVDDMRYGPFASDTCAEPLGGDASDAESCIVNYGATRISLWSAARALDASVLPLTSPVTPSIKYLNPQEGQLTNAELAGLIAGALIALAVVAALVATMLYLLRLSRNNNRAPREPTDPVTLIFTDIESSTALWAAHPELMPDAVAAHHRMIRSLIARYDCYEVKTVGDSFMIASKSPFAAVQLAQELQLCFLHHDWGTNAIDDSYREFEEQCTEGECEYTPPTARLDPEVYSRLWNGLRVRVGIHTGLCDIRHDEVTKGYDYYGRTPNMAARTESVANGGQVLMTRSTYLSLSAEEREQIDVTALGAVTLRGVPKPVEMYQLNAVPGRVFTALQLDREYFDKSDCSSATASDVSSVRGGMNGSSLMIASSLQALLGTFAAAQRRKLLVPLCERWHVPFPAGAKDKWDDKCCEEIICRIAVKVGRVVDLCASSGTERSVSTLRSASLIIIANHFAEHEA
ncbi:receptor-type adenylate cyclase, putative [Schistosoma mansoni]|nr:receptor-type adenylate cyclase, putative [Schistosoma mansoni]|eukprot:XP_018644076.1 receptor-type adenylate cyclase, putative [Schistosoma mansoni]